MKKQTKNLIGRLALTGALAAGALEVTGCAKGREDPQPIFKERLEKANNYDAYVEFHGDNMVLLKVGYLNSDGKDAGTMYGYILAKDYISEDGTFKPDGKVDDIRLRSVQKGIGLSEVANYNTLNSILEELGVQEQLARKSSN